MHANARVELSEAARAARNKRHGLSGPSAYAHIVPMGSWTERVPTTPRDGYRNRMVVYLGYLGPGKGVELLPETLSLLRSRDEDVTLAVIGGGPLEAELRRLVEKFGLQDHLRIHGRIADHLEVERLLASASVAVAPYTDDDASYTPYADPGKLKAYVAAGLPIVVSDVPPNARELAANAGAELAAPTPAAIADAVSRTLADRDGWNARRDAALEYARGYDWTRLFAGLMASLGLNPVTGERVRAT
jgi:phosphatidylinositol alpha-1,6-mannosyltransferase